MRLRADGWLTGVHRRPSPNQDARPPGTEVDLLVIHNISLPPQCFGGPGVYQLFENRLCADEHPFYAEIVDLRVSAHFWIRRSGQTVQFVSTEARAWHAGVSEWAGRSGCNDYSLGIELEGSDERGYSEAQYRSLIRLSRILCARYPGIRVDRVVGHEHIAPGRKTDPGPGFDWVRLRAALKAT